MQSNRRSWSRVDRRRSINTRHVRPLSTAKSVPIGHRPTARQKRKIRQDRVRSCWRLCNQAFDLLRNSADRSVSVSRQSLFFGPECHAHEDWYLQFAATRRHSISAIDSGLRRGSSSCLSTLADNVWQDRRKSRFVLHPERYPPE